MYPQLSDDMIDRVASGIRAFFGSSKAAAQAPPSAD
jgi:hypothetical protein